MRTLKHIQIYIILLIISNSSFAQITFQRTYGGLGDDVFYSVQQTYDGGYIMAGYTNSFGAGGSDVYLVKTDLNGDSLWTKTYGGTQDDKAYCVQQTADSGYIITGSTSSFGTGTKIVYLLKTDINGDTLWTKTFMPINFVTPEASGLSVRQTFDAGYILSCTVASINGYELYLIKTNYSGDTLWTMSYGIHGSGNSIKQTTDSGYIIGGIRYGYDVLLIKTDSYGNLIWKKIYGSSFYDDGYSVEQTSDGGYIVVGDQQSFTGGAYLIKTDSLGDTLWTKAYGGDSGHSAKCIDITNDSGYIIVGFSQIAPGDWKVYLIKTDSIGDTLWTKSYGGSNTAEGNSVQQTNDGGFIIAGDTRSIGSGNGDAYLIKVDINGNSGCYESYTATIVNTPTTMVNIPTDSAITTFNTVANSYPSLVSNGGTINTCATLSINEPIENNLINIYPNPAQDYFKINTNSENNNTEIEIYNLMGEIIYMAKLGRKITTVNCDELLSGIYFVAIKYRSRTTTKKIIILK